MRPVFWRYGKSERMGYWRLLAPNCLALILFAQSVSAQTETLFMAVLSVFPTPQKTSSVAGFLASTDQGRTWQRRGWRGYNRLFFCEQAGDGTIWCGCGNGVLRSTDSGYRWRTTTGWEVTEVLKVKTAESRPSLVFASTPYGIFRSTDSGESWLKTVNGLRRPFSGDICIDRNDPRRIVAATEVGVYVSEDTGDHWSLAGLEGTGVRVIVQDPHEAGRFWLGTEERGVFGSSDGGRHWEPLSEGLKHRTVYAIDVDPVTPGRVYLGTWGGGVYVSSDHGTRWKQTSVGLTDSAVHAVLILPSDPRVVFAGTLDRGLFRSTDAGGTWSYLCQDGSQVWGLSVRRMAGTR
jgi:photosystem II stability/assembly factor-like uncharacterized protein